MNLNAAAQQALAKYDKLDPWAQLVELEEVMADLRNALRADWMAAEDQAGGLLAAGGLAIGSHDARMGALQRHYGVEVTTSFDGQRHAALVSALKTHAGDSGGWEFGLGRVRFDAHGKPAEFLWATQEDIDKAIVAAIAQQRGSGEGGAA